MWSSRSDRNQKSPDYLLALTALCLTATLTQLTRVKCLTGLSNCHLHLRPKLRLLPGQKHQESVGTARSARLQPPSGRPKPTLRAELSRVASRPSLPSAALGAASPDPGMAKPTRPEAWSEQGGSAPARARPAPALRRAAFRAAVTAQDRPPFPPAQPAQTSTKVGAGALKLRVGGSRNVHYPSALRLCASCCRPARFKFPGDAAFRLAGLSLSCAFIGRFEKHVRRGWGWDAVTGPRKKKMGVGR